MKSAGKARNNGLYRHIRTSKEIIRNLLNDYKERYKKNLPYVADEIEALAILEYLNRACRPYGVEWCYSGGIMIRSK